MASGMAIWRGVACGREKKHRLSDLILVATMAWRKA